MKKLPLARSSNIVVQHLGNEILIYDLKSHEAFNLNSTCSIVYQSCDGKTSFEELKLKHSFSDELIFLAIDELKKKTLIKADEALISPFVGMSRREVIRKVGYRNSDRASRDFISRCPYCRTRSIRFL